VAAFQDRCCGCCARVLSTPTRDIRDTRDTRDTRYNQVEDPRTDTPAEKDNMAPLLAAKTSFSSHPCDHVHVLVEVMQGVARTGTPVEINKILLSLVR
jgi:hypothetical protein